jgi:hypothetical protein
VEIGTTGRRRRVRMLMVLQRYPQLSETYVANELRELWPNHEVSILSLGIGIVPQRDHFPYELAKSTDEARVIELAQAARPQIIHTHYLHMAPLVQRIADSLMVPYTIRTHSYDILGVPAERLRRFGEHVNDERCLGILAFPFLRKVLEDAGIIADKIHDCHPVVDYSRFRDRSPNAPGVMNVGAALPKKNMGQYLQLAARMAVQPVRLYPLGYEVPKLRALNDSLGQPVVIRAPVQPDDMPAEYKRHTWLVYTASRAVPTVGWPVAIAEAQASGVGVCVEGIRPDLADYVGAAGFVVDPLSDVLDIIAAPVPESMREAGFEQARLSDVHEHIKILERLWR